MDNPPLPPVEPACFVDLYWLPVGAGTSRMQQWSLDCWEAAAAFVSRRRRARLFHPALKLRPAGGVSYTMELTPAFIGGPVAPAMTGPVGLRRAGHFRLFRYQLRCFPADTLPDEAWAVDSPVRLSDDGTLARQMLDLAPWVPDYTWGRRVHGTSEMWTSASVIAWVLVRAGVDAAAIDLPRGGRAPGWSAGIQVASASGRRARR